MSSSAQNAIHPSTPETRLAHTDQLAALIEQKHACLVQLRDLGIRQQELMEADDMTQLLRILPSKSLLIGTLQRTEHELTPYRDEDPETRTWRSAEARAQCAAQAAECRQLLDAVVRQERANETRMQQRRQDVTDRLNQVHVAARASGAYRTHTRGKLTTPAPQVLAREGGYESGRARPAYVAATPVSGLDLSSDIR